MLVLLLIACGNTDTSCREGTTLAEDGHCYPPLLDQAPRLEDVIAGLPDCEPATGPGEIDLIGGCVYGVCVGQTYLEMVDVLGEARCYRNNAALPIYCEWEDWGLDARFADDDDDDLADDDSGTDRLHLFRPSTAATPDGIGVDANLACFFDGLGSPDRIEVTDRGGVLAMDGLIFDRYGLRAFDETGPGGRSGADGYLDDLYLYGQ